MGNDIIKDVGFFIPLHGIQNPTYRSFNRSVRSCVPALCPVGPQTDRVVGGSEDPPITTYEFQFCQVLRPDLSGRVT